MSTTVPESIDVIAHRGCTACGPENTLPALTAGAMHLDWIEFDVRQCATGELVVYHDATVDAHTDETGPITDYTWEELRTLDLTGTATHIPRLDDVFKTIPTAAGLQIEVKDPAIASVVADQALTTAHPVRLTTFHPDACRVLCDYDVPVGFLFEDDPHANVRRAADWGCTTVHPRADTCLSTDVVDTAHEYDLDVIAWDGITLAQVQKLARQGVAGVTIDRACEWPGIPSTSQ